MAHTLGEMLLLIMSSTCLALPPISQLPLPGVELPVVASTSPLFKVSYTSSPPSMLPFEAEDTNVP